MIKNLKALSKTPLRRKALLVADAGYGAIEIEKAVSRKYRALKNEINIGKYKRVFIIGIGKGSALASISLAKILKKKLTKGIVLDVAKARADFPIKFFEGTHPLPSKKNIRASQEIIELAKGLEKGDLLLSFICGGGSSLFCSSNKELNASRTAFKKLTEAGADIFELNTVRKHVSEVKGGGLAKIAWPADVVSLIASDVLGNDLSMVASGPTVFDRTSKKDAEKVLKKYGVKGLKLTETPKDKEYFRNVKNILFISNKDALLAMEEKAKKLGLKPKIHSYKLRGEAKKALLPLAKKIRKGEAVLAGGETTVKFEKKTSGKGGRNMEAVLGVLGNNIIALSFASDGRDNTEAVGAIGDCLTIEKAERLKLDAKKFLGSHDSFNFFKKTGDLIYADKKSFNVSDLMIILANDKK